MVGMDQLNVPTTEGTFAQRAPSVCPPCPASRRMFQPSITMLYPQTSLPPLAQPRNPKHKHIV